jgi:hypothetical protein
MAHEKRNQFNDDTSGKRTGRGAWAASCGDGIDVDLFLLAS